MSIFGNIMSAILGKKAPAPGTSAAMPGGSAAPTSSTSSTSSSSAAPPMGAVDVEAVLVKMSDEKDEDLNWRQSIVDLMKLLDLDSSLNARKQLAQELGYTGALTGSAEMNVWLHKQVMKKLADNGGKVPESLRS